MKVLHAAAEVFPLIKTGGLADVVASLPPALMDEGIDVRLLLPGLPSILEGVLDQKIICEMGPAFGVDKVTLKLGVMPKSNVPVYIIDSPYLFHRPGNPYQASNGIAWPDNTERFALLGHTAAEIAMGHLDASWRPDILHAHDWHAAMSCAYLHANHSHVPSIFTIHNLAFQGLFPAENFHLLKLPAHFMSHDALEFYGKFSFMKAGLKYATKVTTVSPTYAREIMHEEFGCGLDGLIRHRAHDVVGILNGVDYDVWNPSSDPSIALKYSSKLLEGKFQCKVELQKEVGLKVDPNAFLFGVVSRLSTQKGLDLLLKSLHEVLNKSTDHPPQLIVQGNGDPDLESAFVKAAIAYPGQIAIRHEYNEALAHKVVAGSDAMLVPSRFEPCGLTQLYAMRYGTIPIVRKVGGLADTVTNDTGLSFGPADSHALAIVMNEALDLYRDQTRWREMMMKAMNQDFSWDKSAKAYIDLYKTVSKV